MSSAEDEHHQRTLEQALAIRAQADALRAAQAAGAWQRAAIRDGLEHRPAAPDRGRT